MAPGGPLLVTGASGLLGAAIVLTAGQLDRPAMGIYHSRPIRFPKGRTRSVDLQDAPAVRALLDEVRPSWVIHCAAMTDVDACETSPDLAHAINAGAGATLAAAAATHGAGITYVSTDAFWRQGDGLYGEDHPTDPPNVYAKSKLAGEEAVAAANPDHQVVRTNIFGWCPYGRTHLVEWIVDRLESGQDVPGFTDVRFNPLLANDLARLIFEMMDAGLRGRFNVAGREPVSKFGFAQLVAEALGFNAARVTPASVTAVHKRAARPHDTTLSVERITRALGREMPSVADGVRRMAALRNEGYIRLLDAGTSGGSA